jgi:Putative beta-barrel porin-2, OmpL-like. bbp2
MTQPRSVALGVVCATLAFGAPLACAAEAKEAAKPAAPSLGDVLDASGIAVSGYLDTSYSHLSGDGVFTSGAANRVFDTQQDGFSLQQAALNVGYQPKEGFGAFVNLTLGNDADVIAPYDRYPSTSKFDVTQAYGQYAGSGFTVIAGKYVTLAGAEVIASPSNPNFSRSILFGYAIPFTHTGIRAALTPTDTLTLVVGLTNGWDDLKDTNSSKTIEVGATFAPVKAFGIAASGYFGKERVGGLVGSGTEGERSLIDVVATWNISDALTLIVNGDWGQQDNLGEFLTSLGLYSGPNYNAKWDGVAGYLSYTIDDNWKLALRAEYFDDKDGYRTGVVQKWKEVTGTIAYLPTKHAELRLELRGDNSDVPSFSKSDGADSSRSQQSIAVQALYKF